MSLTHRQILLLITLATDAKDLKVENGWYGDPRQGDSTQAEDEAAIMGLHVLEEMALQAEANERDRKMALLVSEFTERLGTVTVSQGRAKVASAFYGLYTDGDLDGMIAKLGELDESWWGDIPLAVVETVRR